MNDLPPPPFKAALDHQIDALLQRGYPQAAGETEAEFLEHLKPLKTRVPELAQHALNLRQGRLPFVVVVKSQLVPIAAAIARVEPMRLRAFANLDPRQPPDFSPIATVKLPPGMAYLLVDVDRGDAYRNLAPREALEAITRADRSPLTIEEGIATLTQFPDFIQKNRCFSLLASRCGDKRVPALWLSEGRVKLGWCWAGNPHTWLGSASCARRMPA